MQNNEFLPPHSHHKPGISTGKILRYCRIATAVVIFAVITWTFVDIRMKYPETGVWLAKIQFLPATMAFSLATFIIWLIITLIFGRVYCSSVCPMGTLQDIFARIPRLKRIFRPHFRKDYHYSQPLTALRNIALFVVVLSIILGISLITSYLDPYSLYGRLCLNVLQPIFEVGKSLFSSPGFTIVTASITGVCTTLLIIGVIGWLAAKNGRTFCNTVCPVGTTLGYISRYSIFRIDINTDKCIQCRHCEHVCKASCINLEDHVVDTSRCVNCFDCLPVCPNDAIHYTYDRHQLSIPMMQRLRNPLAGSTAGMSKGSVGTLNSTPSTSELRKTGNKPQVMDRRTFLTIGLITAASPIVAKAESITKSTSKTTTVPVMPPGVVSKRSFLDRCTACGLCISRCPHKVIRPSLNEYGLLRMLHPVMKFDESWCEYDCTICSNVCPTGALSPLTIEGKHTSPIGLAGVDTQICVSCGRCAAKCPAHAIAMGPRDADGWSYPVVDASKCIGCGACQYVCPTAPIKAITVNGIN